jgi:predicted nucleic acid-binding protein
VYLFVKGSRTAEAESVLEKDAVWTAPWLWRSEFRNSLAGLVRRQDIFLEEAIWFIEEAERWMEGREYTVRSAQVLQLADRSRCSAYDCEFVALAMDLRVRLVTADQQVLRVFPSIAVSTDAFAG